MCSKWRIRKGTPTSPPPTLHLLRHLKAPWELVTIYSFSLTCSLFILNSAFQLCGNGFIYLKVLQTFQLTVLAAPSPGPHVVSLIPLPDSGDQVGISAQELFPYPLPRFGALLLVCITCFVVPTNALKLGLLPRRYRLRMQTFEVQSRSYYWPVTKLWASYIYSLSFNFLFV